MWRFVQESGPVLFPVLLFGAIALLGAMRYFRNPMRELLSLAVGATAATCVMGILGTVQGLQKAARYIAEVPAEDRWIFLIGLRESLNTTAVALFFGVLVSITLTLGAYRGEKRQRVKST